MSKKSNFVKVASLAAVGAGAAVVLRKRMLGEKEQRKRKMFLQLQITEIQNVEYMKKTAKGFIIPMETMRRLPRRKNRKE